MIESAARETLTLLAIAVSARKVTQEEIAKATGVHQSQVSRILSGQPKKESKNVRRLCKYYELHISGANPTQGFEIPVDIRNALPSLITGSRKSDGALLEVLESLAKWRNSQD